VNNNTPEEQMAADTKKYPGGKMLAFVEWNKARIVEASHDIKEAFFMGHLSNHEMYDAWLTAYVDKSRKENLVLSADEWIASPEFEGVVVMDPDGWDRSNYAESWAEKINYAEMQQRVFRSTCIFNDKFFNRNANT
jgi:hypothetical protein